MRSSVEKIFVILVTSEFLLAILINGFIFLVNFTAWVKSKKLSPSDLILISLAISRIGLSCAIIWKTYLFVTSMGDLITDKVRIIDIILIFTHNSNMWFATTLSISYFLKITSFSHPLFLWLKWRIDRMFYMLLWGPLILSLFISFPLMERMHYYYGSLSIRGKERNVSHNVHMSKSMLLMIEIIVGLLSLIPLTLSTSSFSLFILSLWKHKQKMKISVTGSRDPSTEAHVRAMKSVSFFLILLLLYYIGLFFNSWHCSAAKSKLSFMLGMSIIFLYPFGHSLILILWNSKLRKAAMRVPWLMRCCQKVIYKSFRLL